jgi:hypothetical protein
MVDYLILDGDEAADTTHAWDDDRGGLNASAYSMDPDRAEKAAWDRYYREMAERAGIG